VEDVTGGGSQAGPGAVLRGQVRGADGAPVPGARVSITSSPVPVPEIAAVTDPEGRFELAAPAAGEYALSAHAEGTGAPATGVVNVPASAAAARAAPPADDPDAELSSEAPPAAPGLVERAGGAAAEVNVVLTFQDRSGG
jgi:hypothetical protein